MPLYSKNAPINSLKSQWKLQHTASTLLFSFKSRVCHIVATVPLCIYFVRLLCTLNFWIQFLRVISTSRFSSTFAFCNICLIFSVIFLYTRLFVISVIFILLKHKTSDHFPLFFNWEILIASQKLNEKDTKHGKKCWKI